MTLSAAAMQARILFGTICFVLLMSNTAEAVRIFDTGNDLFQACNTQTRFAQGYCTGFLVGVADSLTSTGGQIAGYRACIPVEVTKRQVQDVVLTWLTNHPAERYNSA